MGIFQIVHAEERAVGHPFPGQLGNPRSTGLLELVVARSGRWSEGPGWSASNQCIL